MGAQNQHVIPRKSAEERNINMATTMTDHERDLWIFVSHSNKDFDKVRKIRNYLEEHACRPLLFYLMCLSDDEEISSLIKREIDCRTRFIFCSSEHSRKSKWVQSEIAYMESSHKSFDTIDLSQSEQEIQHQLDAFLKSTQAYFLFSEQEAELALSVFQHVGKYDFRCACTPGAGGNSSITHSGFVAFFASEHSLNSPDVLTELALAAENGIELLALLVDEYAAKHGKSFFESRYGLKEELHLGGLPDRQRLIVENISGYQDKMEAAIAAIVNKTLPCWDSWTLANNFREGIVCKRDEEEANRLFNIVFDKAYSLAWVDEYPAGFLYLAKCYDAGYGCSRAPHEALRLYTRYQQGYGGNCQADIARLKAELGVT